MSRELNLKNQDLNFLFVSDDAIRKINKKFLNHDYATDVIAFGMEEKGVLGDIVVSLDTAKRQARECKHSYLTELKILAIHGWLHLLGYRDKKISDQKKMWDETNRLMEMIRDIR